MSETLCLQSMVWWKQITYCLVYMTTVSCSDLMRSLQSTAALYSMECKVICSNWFRQFPKAMSCI